MNAQQIDPTEHVQTEAANGTFKPPTMSVKLLYKQFLSDEGGEPLTPEEEKEWTSHVKAVGEYERRRDRLGLVDLADVMENGTTEPEMLTDTLVRSEHHVVFGARESAKTWLVMREAVALIKTSHAVIWVDKEMGRKNMADRLTTLGAHVDEVREHFVYMEFPSMDCGSDSRAAWRALLGEREPSLVVVDAQTEVLADADLNENSGTDIEKWSQAYITPARRIGTATVMIDHTGHSEKGRPVASRQKGAAAKVELSVTKDESFGRDTVGLITVEVTKNTVSAPIREKRSWRIGGEDGRFVLGDAPGPSITKAQEAAERDAKIEQRIIEVLRTDAPLSQTQLTGLVGGRKTDAATVARRLADQDTSPVVVKKSGRSLAYSLDER